MSLLQPSSSVFSGPLSSPSANTSFRFLPHPPKNFEELGIPLVMFEDLIFKILLNKGSLSGRELATELSVHFSIVEVILTDLKKRLLVGYRSNAGLGDFIYILSETGREKALAAREISAYAGVTPVPFDDYIKAVTAQSIKNECVGTQALQVAFSDLLIDSSMLDTLGPAVNSGRGLFLYGEPGNGKTSIAERINRAFKDNIFIPKAIWVDGNLLQIYDPQCHETVTPPANVQFDQRWVLVKRPTVVVGGELTMDSLEISYNPLMRVSEAPLQMKANGGVFLIDDFGRQRVSHIQLLNRWIVPLEKRVDFLVLPSGKKIQVPFDELIIFSTNLNPKDLVDEAFLRRIPYKINVPDPTEAQFRQLFALMAQKQGIPFDEGVLNYLIETHYRGKRPFRSCQPRDLLDQVKNACTYANLAPQLTPEHINTACQNYFGAMGMLD